MFINEGVMIYYRTIYSTVLLLKVIVIF